MNVLYIFDEDDKYGAPKAGIELIREMRKKGVVPIVLTSKKNNVNDWCNEENIENYVTYHHKYTYVKVKNFFNYIIKLMPRYIRYKIGNIVALKLIKKYVDINKIDLIHSNVSGLDLGCVLAKKYNIKHIMHIREFGKLDFNMKSYRKEYIKFLNENVTCFIAISEAIKQYWINQGISNKKITTIYDGIYLDDIKRKKDYKNNEIIKILMLGSITRGKGQLELIDAIEIVNKNNQCLVDIIGTGYKEDEKNVQKSIEYKKLNKIINLKKYDPDIRNKICEYDIGINCSTSEGFGRVTVEYMCAGIPVIASDTGANIEIIDNQIDGIIYSKGDINELAYLIELCIKDVELRKKIGERASEKVREHFSMNEFIKKLERCYKESCED